MSLGNGLFVFVYNSALFWHIFHFDLFTTHLMSCFVYTLFLYINVPVRGATTEILVGEGGDTFGLIY